ncbi:MAG TPA: sulfatase, partial [Blastocatellia bacterium]|nr:sulfatase [Blastocatellia bacterium]
MNNRNSKGRNEPSENVSRRWFIEQCGVGMGAFALNHLLASAGYAATQEANNPLAPKKPHFAPKAKNVIFLF